MSLSLRIGLPHYDYLLPYLSASQLTDWFAFHQSHNVHVDRDDTFWGQFLAMYFAVHKPEREATKKPQEFIPWHKHEEEFISPEELRRRLFG